MFRVEVSGIKRKGSSSRKGGERGDLFERQKKNRKGKGIKRAEKLRDKGRELIERTRLRAERSVSLKGKQQIRVAAE